MRLVYFDCFSGISGDMLLGGFIHLGVPLPWLKENLYQLPLKDFDIEAREVTRSGVQAVKIQVDARDAATHRHLGDILGLITASGLAEKTKSNCLTIFQRLAMAEAKVHNCPVEAVHFHEVGAVDAMVDIIGVCLCLQYLGIESVVCSPLPMSRGFVVCQHGALPLPAPATLELIKDAPVYGSDQRKELVTPTGAAIAVSMADRFDVLPAMRIEGVGYGAGSHELEGGQPNMLRLIKGTARDARYGAEKEKLVQVETAIDDMNPEFYGYLMERLFSDGALDVVWIPAQMKKDRPGILVQVVCSLEKRDAIVRRILSETTTLGVRFFEVQRATLARRTVEVDTPFGRIAAKEVADLDGNVRIVPEFEVCRKIALSRNLTLRGVYDSVSRYVKDRPAGGREPNSHA